jgi:hypothetical protein
MQELQSRLFGGANAFVMPVAFFPPRDYPGAFSTEDGTYAMLVLTESQKKPGCFERVGFTTIEGTNRQLTKGTGYSREYFKELDDTVPWSDDDYTTVTII